MANKPGKYPNGLRQNLALELTGHPVVQVSIANTVLRPGSLPGGVLADLRAGRGGQRADPGLGGAPHARQELARQRLPRQPRLGRPHAHPHLPPAQGRKQFVVKC